MATTKETMNVIANGVDKKEEPEIIMGGKVIAVEVPDELAKVFEGIIGSLIEKSESAEVESPEKNDSNGEDWDDEELTEAEELAADIACWLAHRASDNLVKVAKEEGAIASYKNMLGFMGIEDMGICALAGEENQSEEKLAEIRAFAKSL